MKIEDEIAQIVRKILSEAPAEEAPAEEESDAIVDGDNTLLAWKKGESGEGNQYGMNMWTNGAIIKNTETAVSILTTWSASDSVRMYVLYKKTGLPAIYLQEGEWAKGHYKLIMGQDNNPKMEFWATEARIQYILSTSMNKAEQLSPEPEGIDAEEKAWREIPEVKYEIAYAYFIKKEYDLSMFEEGMTALFEGNAPIKASAPILVNKAEELLRAKLEADERVTALMRTAEERIRPIVDSVRKDLAGQGEPSKAFMQGSDYVTRINGKLARNNKPILKYADIRAIVQMIKNISIVLGETDSNQIAWYSDDANGKGYVNYALVIDPDITGDALDSAVKQLFDAAILDHVGRAIGSGVASDLFSEELNDLFDMELLEALNSPSSAWPAWSFRGSWVYGLARGESLDEGTPDYDQSRNDLREAGRQLGTEGVKLNRLFLWLQVVERELGPGGQKAIATMCALENPDKPEGRQKIRDLPQHQRIILYLIRCRSIKAAEALDIISTNYTPV